MIDKLDAKNTLGWKGLTPSVKKSGLSMIHSKVIDSPNHLSQNI